MLNYVCFLTLSYVVNNCGEKIMCVICVAYVVCSAEILYHVLFIVCAGITSLCVV
jgi:hypothetical protein